MAADILKEARDKSEHADPLPDMARALAETVVGNASGKLMFTTLPPLASDDSFGLPVVAHTMCNCISGDVFARELQATIAFAMLKFYEAARDHHGW